MSVHVNRDDVVAELLPNGATRRRLIDENRVPGTQCRFDVLTIDAGGSLDLQLPRHGVAWAQVLSGSLRVRGDGEDRVLGESQLLFLANAITGRLSSADGAELILLEAPNASQFDSGSASGLPGVQSADLGLEPMLQSEHDERTRIYVATAGLFGTRALIGELVAFPPGTVSQNHHHVGAEHFQYVLRGEATVYLNETPRRLRAGDLLYKYDRERHYCENDGSGELVFVEFFVPGEYETVWVDPERSCAWSPTGTNVLGGEPSRHIATHTSDGSYHQDV